MLTYICNANEIALRIKTDNHNVTVPLNYMSSYDRAQYVTRIRAWYKAGSIGPVPSFK